jgi:hypothetical protein
VCTLTWARTLTGYELFFNRDEQKTRKPALPPALHRSGGVSWLAAIDGDAGGTWLGVNERGVSVGLLNRWPLAGEPDPTRSNRGARSRGLLVAELLDVAGAEQAAARLSRRDLAPFKPFTLAVLEPKGELLSGTWDGRRLALERLPDERQPLCSSGSDPEGATRQRRALWLGLAGPGRLPLPAELLAFHQSHEPRPSAVSVCMHREEADTVSFTHVAVDEQHVALAYRPGSPCAGAPSARLVLARASAAAASRRG